MLREIHESKFFKIIQTLHFAVSSHHKRLLYNRRIRNIKFSAIAHNRKLTVLHMPRNKTGSIVSKVNIDWIPVKPFLVSVNPVGGRIHQTTDTSLALILQRKTALIDLPFSYPHNDPSLRKLDFRLWNMKIVFCQTFDLVLQICHLLILFYFGGFTLLNYT